MLSPKVFTNAKRYMKEGIEENISFNNEDNLIIKGNNLIALSSLLKRFEGKVKFIYIDPPYNTGNDSFNYNDNFNHSSWLVFMKNRLEIAKKLLSEEGVIFVQCDDNEQAYLKVLMDEIFLQEHFIGNIIWNSINSVLKNSKFIRKDHEYILIYSKNKKYINAFNKLENSMNFKNPDNDPRGAWCDSNAASPNQKNSKNRFSIKLPNGDFCERNWKFTFEDFKTGKINLFYKEGNVPRLKIYESDYKKNTKTPSSIFENLGSITSAKFEIEKIFNKSIFDTPKPEILIKRIIELSTKTDDIVLDFFVGSGTTCAVAHKMNRRYIGIEQMNYIKDITVERMKKVINGEQGGISKSVNWQGGGSFVYCELKENAQELINKIQELNESNINDFKEKFFNDERIIPFIRKEDLDKSDHEFNNLSLREKQEILINLINKNKLYVDYSEIDDEDYKISENDKKFTHSFYRKEE